MKTKHEKKKPVAPIAAKNPKRITKHGDTRIDEYAWLRNVNDPLVREHIKKENLYTDSVMKDSKKMENGLYKEMRKRVMEDEMSVPVKNGEYYYYVRTKKGKQYRTYCRKRGKNGKEEVTLDENTLARGKKFFSTRVVKTNPDHTMLAYSVDTTGNEDYTLYIKNIKTGILLKEIISSVSSVAWAEDGEHILYTQEEHPFPPRKVFVHRIGESTKKDKLIYEEKDRSWAVGLGKSKSKEYIFVEAGGFHESEVRILGSKNPHDNLKLVAPRKKEVNYHLEHHGKYLYIVTNEKAVNYKIMRTPVEKPSRKYWRTWMTHRTDRSITGFTVQETFFAIDIREKGLQEILIYDVEKKVEHIIKLPEVEHSVSVNPSLDPDSKVARLYYESLTTPLEVLDYNPKSKKYVIRKRRKIPGYKKGNYISKRVWAKSGTVRVPIEIVYKKGLRKGKGTPLHLRAYGCYGINMDPGFGIDRLSLLDRGWIVAMAHPRGGGEMGWNWHRQAYLLKKKNTAKDFIASAKYLIKNGYTSSEKLAISGGSAGGMLMGMVLNEEPELFTAAISYVPAADILTHMLDESLPGTKIHYAELGDPRKISHYKYLKSYSPYENVRKTSYPHHLVKASLHDIRTPYWEAAKWVARLRDRKVDTNMLLLKIEMASGHGSKSGRYEWLKERAFDYAFLLKALSGKN
jgi:oligopeptidase B